LNEIVSSFRVWAPVLALAIGLAGGLTACGNNPPPLVLQPGGGFSADREEGVSGTLEIPDQVSAQAALIQAEIALENRSGDVRVLTVPRPCDVQDWVIRDQAGAPVMVKDAIECIQQTTAKPLAPGETLRERIVIYLLPRVLAPGKRYTIDYRFWGQPATASFTAR
jgi:hypothetical protein